MDGHSKRRGVFEREGNKWGRVLRLTFRHFRGKDPVFIPHDQTEASRFRKPEGKPKSSFDVEIPRDKRDSGSGSILAYRPPK